MGVAPVDLFAPTVGGAICISLRGSWSGERTFRMVSSSVDIGSKSSAAIEEDTSSDRDSGPPVNRDHARPSPPPYPFVMAMSLVVSRP